MHQTRRQIWPLGLIYGLAGLVSTGADAMPDIARATASVTARVLAPVSLAVAYDSAKHTRPARLIISRSGKQTFQVHIDSNRYHSYQTSNTTHEYPLQTAAARLKLTKPRPQQPNVTLYFN